jgi:hypothetical protein
MLDISFGKLAPCANEQVFTHKPRLGMDESHGVLQLVAETKGSPGLVISAPTPEPAGQSLIKEPAIGKEIDGWVGCFHLDGTKRVVPVLPNPFECLSCCRGVTDKTRKICGAISILPGTEGENNLPIFPVIEFKGYMHSCTGIQRSTYPAGKDDRVMASGVGRVPLRPMNSVRSALTVLVA